MKITNQRISGVMITGLAAACFAVAGAQDIAPGNVTPSTSMTMWGGFSVAQISDGISADCAPTCNGFTTNSKAGTITFMLSEPHDVSGFKLWNDVSIRKEGIKTFRLDLRNSGPAPVSTPIYTATWGKPDAQVYTFPTVKDVTEIDLVVLSSIKEDTTFAERIEVREVAFVGIPSRDRPVPAVPFWALALGGLTAIIGAGLLLRAAKGAKKARSRRKPKAADDKSPATAEKVGGIGVVAGAGAAMQAGQSARPSRPRHPENSGVIFPASPMQAANVATPLSPAGQLTASNLQMLTGQFAALRPAYHATGRIGYAQEGVPTSEDYSFGTGFLISPDHVMTNRHVHGIYGHYLTTQDDCGGIEFIAEKDKDASDFIPFNGEPPVLLPGLDIAIYTLSRPAEGRTPIAQTPVPTQELEGKTIAVVGYPDTHEPNDPEILSVVEDDPVFAVKRISQGTIFRHSTDDDDPYGVEVSVAECEKTNFPMPAICHNASTLGGNSGSPILDINTGALLGVHFAGHKIFNQKEAANLAMAIAQLTAHDGMKTV